MTRRPAIVVLLILVALGGVTMRVGTAHAEEAAATDQAALGRTPPRLSLVDGEVSFRRPGVTDWVGAAVNTALAPSDEIYTGPRGNVELQVGARAFVRAGAGTQVGLVNQEPDFLQFKVTSGHASLDLRSLEPGHTVELDTPNAAFTIEHTGYYRVDVTQDATLFITRRGGRATVTPASGEAAAITPSEEVIVTGTGTPRVETYVAPELDPWDRWNYERTDHLIDSVSARYVSPGVYGVDALDHHGTWRIVPAYGSVWVPAAVPVGWAPYTTGIWGWDPRYGWTWVDMAPWGWAPYHYGRWVLVNEVWAWAPGPIVAAPVYSPALVAFFGAGSAIGWVALGWGEPLVPWWGPVGFLGVPRWAGWGGPRIVNNVVVTGTTVIHATHITVYRNVSVQNAMVLVHRNRFGQGAVAAARLAHAAAQPLAPLHGALPVAPRPMSPEPGMARGVRPRQAEVRRPVVGTRAPRDTGHPASPPVAPAPPSRLVPAPRSPQAALESPRPPFGAGTSERPQPAQPPRFQGARRPEVVPPVTRAAPESGAGLRPTPTPRVSRPAAPPMTSAPAQGVRPPRAPARPLPGKPANRLFQGRSDRSREVAPQPPPGVRQPG